MVHWYEKYESNGFLEQCQKGTWCIFMSFFTNRLLIGLFHTFRPHISTHPRPSNPETGSTGPAMPCHLLWWRHSCWPVPVALWKNEAIGSSNSQASHSPKSNGHKVVVCPFSDTDREREGDLAASHPIICLIRVLSQQTHRVGPSALMGVKNNIL